MKRVVKKLFKEGANRLADKSEISWLKKKMVKAYLASPTKVQYALAKFGVRSVVNKKKIEIEDFLRH